jgi:hypothetical protein
MTGGTMEEECMNIGWKKGAKLKLRRGDKLK